MGMNEFVDFISLCGFSGQSVPFALLMVDFTSIPTIRSWAESGELDSRRKAVEALALD